MDFQKAVLVHRPSNSDGLSEGRRGGSRAASTHQIYSDDVLVLQRELVYSCIADAVQKDVMPTEIVVDTDFRLQ